MHTIVAIRNLQLFSYISPPFYHHNIVHLWLISIIGHELYYIKRNKVWRKNEVISYDKLWITMKRKGITQYSLIKNYHISAGQLSRLRNNSYVSTHTIDVLCNILNCDVGEIMSHIKDSNIECK